MIDLNNPQEVCRSLGYFLNYLGTIAPLVGLALATWRLSK